MLIAHADRLLTFGFPRSRVDSGLTLGDTKAYVLIDVASLGQSHCSLFSFMQIKKLLPQCQGDNSSSQLCILNMFVFAHEIQQQESQIGHQHCCFY